MQARGPRGAREPRGEERTGPGPEVGPPDKVRHAPFRAEQIGAAGLHHALLGHFHTPRDAPDHTYPGNPEPLTFGEAGPRGAVLVTVDGTGTVHTQRHRVAVTSVHDIVVDLDGADVDVASSDTVQLDALVELLRRALDA